MSNDRKPARPARPTVGKPDPTAAALPDFSHLTPDLILQLVETFTGTRCSNLCRPLGSYINRVYEVQLDDGTWLIAKFYRPGRWTRDAIAEEHQFLLDLQAAEIPVIAPIRGANGETLHVHNGMCFSLFPKKGGRPLDEPRDQQWQELGRLLARMHQVGAERPAPSRIRLHPSISTAQHLEEILRSDFGHPGVKRQFEAVAKELLELITPMFDDLATQRIHGDCHQANILHRPGESFFLIDFDDMAMGPTVQDLWMILPGHVSTSRAEIDALLEGYETFVGFDRSTLRLIEPLRAMRFLHFTAWCAHQKADGGFSRLSPDWGSAGFWRQEIADLERQHREILDARDAPLW